MTVKLVKRNEVAISLLLLIFQISITPNNCQEYSNCTFNATDGNQVHTYNFKRLSRQDVWEAGVGENTEFAYISVCHPVKKSTSQCKGSSFCISKEEDGNWNIALSNTGPYQIKPQEDRKFMMELEGTKPCALDSSKNYSVVFYFTCTSIDHDPIVPGVVNDGCVLLVTWETPAACPVINECVVGNYDLSSLSQPVHYTIETNDGRLFHLSLCGNLDSSSPCQNNATNPVTACEIIQKNKTNVIIGQSQQQSLALVQNTGLTLTYKTKKKGPKTIVRFICDADAKDSIPQFVRADAKVYYFEVETPQACNNFPQECLAFNKKGGRYDLKSLRRKKDNYVIPSVKDGELYYINVCGPLNAVPDLHSITDERMEVALFKEKDKSVTNLGTLVDDGRRTVEDDLTLHFVGGAPCPDGGRHRVEIEFSCSKYNRGPVHIKTTNECVHHFSWESTVACPTLLDIANNCQVQELQHGYHYDLSVLRSKMDRYLDTGHDSYRINLCGPLKEPCNNKNASICLKRNNKEIAIGSEAATAIYENGGLRIVTEGDACMDGYNKSTVRIILLCKYGKSVGEPELFPQSECDFYFVWYTYAACPPQRFTPCTVEHKGHIYDLGPLTEVESNRIVVVRDKNLKFSINVCRSVVFGTEAMCEYSSGVCMLNMSDPNPTSKFTNIGDVGSGPYIDESDGKLKIKYDYGKICLHEDGPDHIYTIITFECDKEDHGPFPLVGDVCVYKFLWRTPAACYYGQETVEPQGLTNDDCSVIDPVTNYRFDLSPLQNIEKTVTDTDGHNYTFVVCGNLTKSPCGSTSGVCQTTPNEHWNAGVGNSRLKYQRYALLLEYENGASCNKSLNRSTTIEFICADNSSEKVVFIDETQGCSYLISWHTKLACRKNLYVS